MGCGCGGSRTKAGTPKEIVGYEYINPQGVSSLSVEGAPYLTLAEARVEQRAYGGGTIKGIRREDAEKVVAARS